MGIQEAENRFFIPERFGRIGVEAVGAVRDTITHLPHEKLGALTSKLENSFQGPTGIKRAIVVRELLRADSSKEFNLRLRVSGIGSGETNALLRNRMVFDLVESMIELPAKYRMPLGIVFSSMRFDQLPESIREAMIIYQADNHFNLRKSHKDWYLCDHLEPYLKESVEKDEAMSVTDDTKILMLMQFKEKMAGICQESFISDKGKVFLEGNLYVPVGKWFRDKLQTAHKKGLDKMVLTEGSWVFMRAVRGIADNMMSAESVLKYTKRTG